jgi:hypothetical protein
VLRFQSMLTIPVFEYLSINEFPAKQRIYFGIDAPGNEENTYSFLVFKRFFRNSCLIYSDLIRAIPT